VVYKKIGGQQRKYLLKTSVSKLQIKHIGTKIIIRINILKIVSSRVIKVPYRSQIALDISAISCFAARTRHLW
jgi:hypothetical protein